MRLERTMALVVLLAAGVSLFGVGAQARRNDVAGADAAQPGELQLVQAAETARDAVEAVEEAAGEAGRAAEQGGSLVLAVLSWLVVGLLVGALARFLMPGPDPAGLLMTSLIGIAGAIIGGFLAGAVGLGSYAGPSSGGLVIAVIGAMLLLGVRRMIRRTA